MEKINFEQLTSIPISMGGQIELPKELDYLGDKKPYIIYDKEFKTKKKSKKYGDGAREYFTEIRKTMNRGYLNQYHCNNIINLMDRYYRKPDRWRAYRPHIVCIEYAFGEKWGEDTFYFHLNKYFNGCFRPYISNPSVINGPVCFSSPKIHDNASDRNFVMNMFRRSVEDQIIDFKYNKNNGQSGVHEVHHKDTTFINLMLGFADQVMKIHSRVDFESYIKPFGKYYPSDGARFDKDNLNLTAALSLPSIAAFLLNVKYPILSGSVVSRNFSMCSNNVCVLPVPGGPYIIVLIYLLTPLSYFLNSY